MKVKRIINLGRNKATGFPKVYIPPTVLDRILTMLSIISTLAIWLLILVFYIRQSVTLSNNILEWGIVSLLLTTLLLITLRFPQQMFHFLVTITETNLWRQLFLAKRFIRVAILEMNLILILRLFNGLGIWSESVSIANFVLIGLLCVSFVVYFVLSWLWR